MTLDVSFTSKGIQKSVPAAVSFEYVESFEYFKLKFLNLIRQSNCEAEKLTEEIDNEAMRYLSWVLYPLLAGGAVYSLLYTPHKSWYSWTIQSAVNAVYAFGFLFMLPQLFVNYK